MYRILFPCIRSLFFWNSYCRMILIQIELGLFYSKEHDNAQRAHRWSKAKEIYLYTYIDCILLFLPRSRIFHSYRDVTVVSEELQKWDPSLEQGRGLYRAIPATVWQDSPVYLISFCIVAVYDKLEVLRTMGLFIYSHTITINNTYIDNNHG